MGISGRRRWGILPILVALGLGLAAPASPATAALPASPTVASPTTFSPATASLTLAPAALSAAALPASAVQVTGRIVDENGWPVADLLIDLTDSAWALYSEPVPTGSDGSFSIIATDSAPEGPAASYAATLTFYDFTYGQFGWHDPLDVTLVPGTVNDLGVVRLSSAEHTGRAAGTVNTSSKKAVRRLYRKGFEKNLHREQPVKVSGCTVSATPKGLRKREVKTLNTFRSLAGVEPVTLSAVLSKRASRAAVIQLKQGYLDHYPSRNATCNTKTGLATSAKSNLSYGMMGAPNILGYMTDPGASNIAAGHRGWFLSPGLEKVGTGYAGVWNAFHVVSRQDPANARPMWVPWPTAGWFPAEFEPWGRWSFMTPRSDLDFSRAKVSVKVAGKPVKISLHREDFGYGYLHGVTWDLHKTITVKGSKTVKAHVTVSNIKLRGASTLPPVTYTVKLFNAES